MDVFRRDQVRGSAPACSSPRVLSCGFQEEIIMRGSAPVIE